MKTLILCLILMFLGCLSFSTEAQTLSDQDPDHPIATVAPNLPQFLRSDGTGDVFYGIEREYETENNISRLKSWVSTYPEEYSNYQLKINEYFSSVNVESLTSDELEIYYDVRSQWIMLSQSQIK